jgi:hypothetical protein
MADIPSNIEGILKELDDQTKFLSMCLTVYLQIFYSPQEKKGMLDQVAGSAFVVIQKALWSEILMLINRLADHAGKPNEEKLSFERLYSEIGKSDLVLARKLRKTWRTIEGSIRAEVKRDRITYLAHIGLKYALSGELRRDIIRPGMVKKAIQTFQDFMLIVLHHYYPDRTFTYDSSLAHGGDDLIAVIEDGLRYRELEKHKS